MNTDTVDAAVRTLAGQISNGYTTPDVTVADLLVGVRILADTESHPSDCDEYGPADHDAFKNGDWRFVGLHVVARHGATEITSRGVWAVELGRTEGDIETSYLEAIIHAELAEITDELHDMHQALTQQP